MTDSRVRRGRKSEEVAASYLRSLYPKANAVAASHAGRDILDTPGFAPEVKARRAFEPIKAMQQAERNAGKDIPMVVLRMDGQGEESVADWLCIFRFKHAKQLMEAYGSRRSTDRSSPGNSFEGIEVWSGLRVESGSGYPRQQMDKGFLSSLLYALGFEPGDYEMEIRRRQSGDRAA